MWASNDWEPFRLVEVDRIRRDDSTRARHGGDLDAGAKSGIESDHDALTCRGREQELLEAASKDGNRLVVGARLELHAQIDFD